MTKYTARIGSVSHGTMNPADLVPTFLYELGQLDKAAHDKIVAAFADVLDSDDVDTESDDYADAIGECLQDLFEELDSHAPSYCYFGAHQGDGSDYGYWPCWEQIDEARQCGDLPSGDELPDEAPIGSEFLEVNDHGNATLYVRGASEWREVWSCV